MLRPGIWASPLWSTSSRHWCRTFLPLHEEERDSRPGFHVVKSQHQQVNQTNMRRDERLFAEWWPKVKLTLKALPKGLSEACRTSTNSMVLQRAYEHLWQECNVLLDEILMRTVSPGLQLPQSSPTGAPRCKETATASAEEKEGWTPFDQNSRVWSSQKRWLSVRLQKHCLSPFSSVYPSAPTKSVASQFILLKDCNSSCLSCENEFVSRWNGTSY